MIHECNMCTEEFNAIVSGKRTFTIWTNEKPYKEGDMLALNEHDKRNSCLVYVDYLVSFNDLVIMSIKPCTVYKHTEPINLEKLKRDYSVPLATREE